MDDALARALDPMAIGDDAAAAHGSPNWDDSEVLEPLGVIVDAVTREAQLHEAGTVAAGARLRNLLRSYIGMQQDAHANPEILDVKIAPPVVAVGLPRSGTTLLHALLGVDPVHRAPVWWEALRPSPPPDIATYATDPRRKEVQAEFDQMLAANPALVSSIPYGADLVTECNTITQPSLRTLAFGAAWHVPSYEAWYLSADQGAMFRYHRRALQQLQWRVPTKRWALKAPPHLFSCDALMGEYPDATIIEIHRDPAKTMASGASLFYENRVLHSDHVDKEQIGRAYLDMWVLANERMEQFRAARPDVKVIDVLYQELVADPITVMRDVYDQMGEDFTPEAESGMRQWLVDNARDKRPEHKYALEEFGMSIGDIDESFGAYLRHYDIPMERS
jgi:hypothetical protein